MRNAVGEEPSDRFLDTVFPKGGTDIKTANDGYDWRYKIKESYMYSDPTKTGR